MPLTATTCPTPKCSNPKQPGQYLCGGCWYTLPRAARGPLLRRDDHAADRLRELYRQLQDGVPLRQIKISIR